MGGTTGSGWASLLTALGRLDTGGCIGFRNIRPRVAARFQKKQKTTLATFGQKAQRKPYS